MDSQRSLLDCWPGEFARTLEMMTGSPVRAAAEPGSGDSTLWWENRLGSDSPLRLSVGASRETWYEIGSAILNAAGLPAGEEEEVRSTWLEVVEQAASAAAGAITTSGSRFESETGAISTVPDGPRHRVVLELGEKRLAVELVVQADMAGASETVVPKAAAAAAGAGSVGLPDSKMERTAPLVSRTMEALLDIHLPISISFGHARMPLKDVLKLTTGTVVELNRQPEDPVDIIVNDCVIARGEVVVVDGNYAVRIQTIIGRQERLGLGHGGNDTGRVN